MSSPSKNTFPEVGLSKAPIIFNRVDFPLPEGPTTDTNSPLFTEKLTFLSDTTLPIEETYTLERFSTFRATSNIRLDRQSFISCNFFSTRRLLVVGSSSTTSLLLLEYSSNTQSHYCKAHQD